MKRIKKSMFYFLAGLLLGIHLIIYFIWYLIGSDSNVDYGLRQFFWVCGIGFIVPLFLGLFFDERFGLSLKFGLSALASLVALFTIFILPFSVRTYRLDFLTLTISLLGLFLVVYSSYHLAKSVAGN